MGTPSERASRSTSGLLPIYEFLFPEISLCDETPPCLIRRRRNPGRSVTNLRRTGSRIFSGLTLQCARMTLNLRLRGRVGSPRGRGRLTSEVAVGVGGGGCFPGNDTGFTGDLPDPTRPPTRPRPRTSTSYLVPRQRAFDATSHWRVLSRRVERVHISSHDSRGDVL